MREPNRIVPKIGAEHYKTYQLLAPINRNFRDGTCEEAGCLAHQYGWRTRIDETTELGQRQAYYIRKQSGRHFTEEREAGITVFSFTAGQPCFTQHKVSLEREPLYLVKDGDFRGNPRGTAARRHSRPEYWVEDFAEHQQSISDAIEKG